MHDRGYAASYEQVMADYERRNNIPTVMVIALLTSVGKAFLHLAGR